jgi:hypothetical protein
LLDGLNEAAGKNTIMEAIMRKKTTETLDIHENLEHLKEPLYLASDLVEFFSEAFREEMSHDDSEPTRRKLREIRRAVIEDLNKLSNVLTKIDPDLVLEWKFRHVSCEDSDVE